MLPSDSILDHLPFSVAVLDRDGNVVRANRALLRTLGVSDVELPGHQLPLTSVDPDDREGIQLALDEARSHGQAQTTFGFTSADGHRGMALLFAKGVGQQQPTESQESLIVSIVDRTDLGYAEANLVQSESLYRSFLEQSPMGVLHLDAVGNVTFENQQFRRILGDDPRFSWIEKNLGTIPEVDINNFFDISNNFLVLFIKVQN